MPLSRRTFVQSALSTTAGGLLLRDLAAQSYAPAQTAAKNPPAPPRPVTEETVVLVGDSAPLTAAMRVQLLAQQLAAHESAGDSYLKGGAVEELEHRFATLLGKEDCAFTATGTLANNLAIRVLCGDRKHALVQAESHLYRDESDAASVLSGLTLVPLAAGKASPSFDEISSAVNDAVNGPYPIAVGAVSLESPVRRQDGAGVPLPLVERISQLAHSKGIGMHLDGARLLLFSGRPGFDLRAYAAPFDTVYVSLYKYLGAPFGSVLAGNKETIAKVRDLRHIYGGMIYQGWQAALPALAALPGFAERFTAARQAGDQLLAGLQAAGGFTIKPVADGSNITHVEISPERARGLHDRLLKADIRTRLTENDTRMPFFVNESITRKPVAEMLAAFTGTA